MSVVTNTKSKYWLDLCDEDILTAEALVRAGRFLHAGLFCHLVVEKALKAITANITDAVPPRIHDLNKLADRAQVLPELSESQLRLLDILTPLQIEARYPEYKEKISAALNFAYCQEILAETEAFLCWIKHRLEK